MPTRQTAVRMLDEVRDTLAENGAPQLLSDVRTFLSYLAAEEDPTAMAALRAAVCRVEAPLAWLDSMQSVAFPIVVFIVVVGHHSALIDATIRERPNVEVDAVRRRQGIIA